MQKNNNGLVEKMPKTTSKERVCCACKKEKKIVNTGGPPLCETCYPLACNWSKALDKHQEFMMSIAGITPLEINIGRNDDVGYFLEEIAKYHADVKMKLKQADVCLINICTIVRNEKQKKNPKGKQITFEEMGNIETIVLPKSDKIETVVLPKGKSDKIETVIIPKKPKKKIVDDASNWEPR